MERDIKRLSEHKSYPSFRGEFEIALQIAEKAHEGQKDKVGADYILHPVKVSGYCKTERAKIAALLHDVIEDTSVTLEDLRAAGIGEDVILAVDCLTKRDGEPIDAYFDRIVSDDIAIEVKFADMRHNSDVSRWPADMKEKATQNAMKYGDRIRKLYRLIGGKRAATLMSKETYDDLFPFIIEVL